MRSFFSTVALSAAVGLCLGAASSITAAPAATRQAANCAPTSTRTGLLQTRSVQPDCVERTSAPSRPRRPSARRARPSPLITPPALAKPPAPPAARPTFTAEEEKAAAVPGIPDARFWADSEPDFRAALAGISGPWLALSAGGEDAAFSAGLLNGLAESGRRPDFTVVTGVSSGALLAPFVFLGKAGDEQLRESFTAISAADVFEDVKTIDALFDTWPLRAFIAKRITPDVLAAVAAEHQRGRRLFVLTTNIDAGRPVAWNMGAIAAHGGEDGLRLFRDVLLASSAIPGIFPPVLMPAEANGRRFQEMHVDGGLASTVFVAPDSVLFSNGVSPLPSNQITILVNGKLRADFEVVGRSLPAVLGRSLSLGVKRATRAAVLMIAAAARRNGADFNLAYVADSFHAPSHGLFDPKYMQALFDFGASRGRSAEPFVHAAPGTDESVDPQSSQAAQ